MGKPLTLQEAGLPSTVVLPLTNLVGENALPLRVRIAAGNSGPTRDSDILIDQIPAWDSESFRRDLGPEPEAVQDEVRRALFEFTDLL